MTQDEFKLFTGETVSYTAQDWATLTGVWGSRLASFLCLEALPETLPDDLKMLFANFMSIGMAQSGNNEPISSKQVRNFTINFDTSNATNAFAKISSQYYDIIEKYSNCGLTFNVEKSARRCCDGRI